MYYQTGYKSAPNLSNFPNSFEDVNGLKVAISNPQPVAKLQLSSSNPIDCNYCISKNQNVAESNNHNSPPKNKSSEGCSALQMTTQSYRPGSFTTLCKHAQNLQEQTVLARLESEGLQLMLLKQYLKTTSFQLKQFKQITDLSKECSRNDYSNPVEIMKNLQKEIENIGTNQFHKYCTPFSKPLDDLKKSYTDSTTLTDFPVQGSTGKKVEQLNNKLDHQCSQNSKRVSLDNGRNSTKFTNFRAQGLTEQKWQHICNKFDQSSQTPKEVSFYDQLLVEPQELLRKKFQG